MREPPAGVLADGVNSELNKDSHDTEECSPHGRGGVYFRFGERSQVHSPLPQLVHELQGHNLTTCKAIQRADNKGVTLA